MQLNRDLRITGYVIDSQVSNPQHLPSRTAPIYSISIQPSNPYLQQQISQAYEQELGQSREGRQIVEEIQSSKALVFDSILKPMVSGLPFDGAEFMPGQLVDVSCRFETSPGPKGLFFPRFVLRFVDLAVQSDGWRKEDERKALEAEARYGALVF
jgi:hypothetical protein